MEAKGQPIEYFFQRAIARAGSQAAFGARIRSTVTGEPVSQATASDWAAGRKKPGPEYLPALAAQLWPEQAEAGTKYLLERYYGVRIGCATPDELAPDEKEFIALLRQLPNHVRMTYEDMGRTLAKQT
jgi:hypothetical protein